MRVALLAANLSRSAGGLAYSVPRLAAALRRHAGCDAHVVGVWNPSSPDDWRSWRGAPVHALRLSGPPPWGWAPLLPGTLVRLAPDLLHAQGMWMYPSVATRGWHRRTRRPYLVTPRGMLDPWALRRSAARKAVALALFERARLRGAACLHATSEMEAGHIRRLGLRAPVAVVPNGVDIPEPPAGDDGAEGGSGDRRGRVLFLGRIHPVKGIDLLLRAWALVEAGHPAWELVVAGPDQLGHASRLGALAASLGLRRARFMEGAFGEARTELYRSASLLVLPSHAESFGLVVAEALAHAVPAVATTGTPWRGLGAERCGWWVDGSPEGLAQALREGMALPERERRAMGRRGADWMRRDFAWPAVARRMREVYGWALGGGPPPACMLTD